MPNFLANTTSPTIRVQVGPASPPRVTAINYGGASQFSIKSATDIDMTTAVDGGAIVYNAATQIFTIKTPNIDNGFF
jgi:hypothetical protein